MYVIVGDNARYYAGGNRWHRSVNRAVVFSSIEDAQRAANSVGGTVVKY